MAIFNGLLAQPPNDNLCNATPLTLGMDCSGITNISTDFATAQTNEPNFTCGSAAHDTLVYNSVWYSFVAPAGPVYLLAAPDSAIITNSFQMSVYSLNGDCADLSNLELVACNTPSQNLQPAPAIITTLTEGETYYVSVSCRTVLSTMATYSNTGCMSVMEVAPPPNDAACDAIGLAVNAGAQVFSNVGATAQPGETAISPPAGTGGPLAVGNDGWALGTNVIDNSVWFTFTTGAEGGNYSIDLLGSTNLPGSFNTQLAVYTATDCNDFSTFTYVGASDNSVPGGGGFLNIHSKLDLFCLPGSTTYHVLVDGGASFLFQPIASQGLFSIQVTESAPVPLSTVSQVEGPDCAGGSDGTIVIAAAGGAGGFSYAWSTGDSTQALRNVLPAGSYTVSITDICGEELVETFAVPAALNDDLAIDAGEDLSGCEGSEVQLNATATGGTLMDTKRVYLQKFAGAGNHRLIAAGLQLPEMQDTISSTQATQMRELEFVGDDLYGASSSRYFYSVNATTGDITLVDTLLVPSVADLSYVPAEGKLYLTTNDGDVYEVDPATAGLTSAVSTGLTGIVQATIDNTGTMYAFTDASEFYSVPLATGAPALITTVPFSLFPFRGFETDPWDDKIYLTASTTIAQGSGISWQAVLEVDKATGDRVRIYRDFTSVGPTGAFAIQGRTVAPYEYAWAPAGGLDDAAIASPVFTLGQTTAFTATAADFCGTVADEITVALLPTEMMTLDTIIFIGDTYSGIVITSDTTILETFVGSNGCDGLLTININAQPNATFETWPAGAISIFPNPVASRLTLNTEGILEKEVTVVLLDIYGQRVWRQPRTAAIMDVDVSYLPSGMYILEIRSAGKRAAKRFVKQ